MAVETDIQTGVQMSLNRWTCTVDSDVIKRDVQQEEKDFCVCTYIPDYCELAFYNIEEPDNEYQNDYRKFLINMQDDTGVFEFFIEKDGVDYVFDTTYGEVFEQGFNEEQPLQTGINVQWAKVANSLGSGTYKVKYNKTNYGSLVTFESHKFKVVPFDVNRANQTIRIEVNNVGLTMNGSDWSGLNTFVNMVRCFGVVKETGYEKEVLDFEDQQRSIKQRQAETFTTYQVSVEDLPESIGNQLIKEDILMDWQLTDYNVFNYNDIRKLLLRIESVSIENTENTPRKFFTIDCRETINKVNRPYV